MEPPHDPSTPSGGIDQARPHGAGPDTPVPATRALPVADDDAIAPLRAAVAALDETAPADRPAAFEAVNAQLVAALRSVDDG